jgi:ribosomal protein S18 acetylase RimI-like enzyme
VIRTATSEDLPLVRRLWEEFCAEIPDLPWRDDDGDDEIADLEQGLAEGSVVVADEGGIAAARRTGKTAATIDLLYVRPAARGAGLAGELVRAAAARLRELGVEHVELNVLESNDGARRLYESLGFVTVERVVAAPVESLLAEREAGPTFGRVHVQTDDVDAVTRNVEKVLPRLGRPGEHGVSDVENGWVSVHSDLTNTDPVKLRALAKELSFLSGVALALGVEEGAVVRYALFDRGSLVDEYASLPEYNGPLPPGDVVALGANPTVLARLTGADPQRVREVVRTASSPHDLPPALELYESVAELIGVAA